MKKIPSFEIDHERLLRGIYVSRKDRLGAETVTTFDVRLKRPNIDPVIKSNAMHTIEHLGATFLRNHPAYGDQLIYFGPMGCFTGVYVVLKGDLASADVISMMRDMFAFIAAYEGEVPGAAPKDCGNYTDHELAGAKVEAKKFHDEVLMHLKAENLNYPDAVREKSRDFNTH